MFDLNNCTVLHRHLSVAGLQHLIGNNVDLELEVCSSDVLGMSQHE